VMDCKLLTGKICILTLIIFILVMSLAQPLYAAVAVKMISGQAVLTEGVEKARKESISDALSEALNDYIYKDMAVNHKFEPQIDEIIFKNRNLYIKNFEIQSERTLGELYQIELKVELNSELIASDLKKIEHTKRLQVKVLELVVLSPEPAGSADGLGSGSHSGGLSTPVLEPTVLEIGLQQGLEIYGFELTRVAGFSPELKSMFIKLMNSDHAGVVREFKASWFKGLMNGDLVVVVRPSEVREEQVASLRKSFWHSMAKIAFIDMKNSTITRLPTVSSKVISSDYVVGMERLTNDLNLKIRKSVVDRLLRDYIVPGGSEKRIVLKCTGFRQTADFITFKQRFKSLQTVKRVELKELSRGSLTLEITSLTSVELLLKWLENSAAKDLPFRLSVTPLPVVVGVPERNPETVSAIVTPLSYLVQVIYGAPDDI